MKLTQPAITHHIHELEERFRIPLFERVGNRVHLTPAGEKLLEYGIPLLEHDVRAREAMRAFIEGFHSRVRIGTSMTVLMYLLPPILRQLKTDHPHLAVRLKTGLTADTLRLLKEKELDLGLCALPVETADFDIMPILDDDLSAILPSTIREIPEVVTPAFLARLPLILGNSESALRRSVTEWLGRAGPVPTPIMELDNVEAIKSVVASGLGSSVVPSLSLRLDWSSHTNVAVRPLKPRVTRQIALVKLRGQHSTDAISLVYEALLGLRRDVICNKKEKSGKPRGYRSLPPAAKMKSGCQ